MLFCCLWRDVETSCDKYFVVLSRHQQTPPRFACGTVSPTASYWRLAGSSVSSTHWSQILAQNRDFCLPHLHSTLSLGGLPSEYCNAVWYGKTRMAWLRDGEKIKDAFIRFDNVRTWRTHRRTDTAWRLFTTLDQFLQNVRLSQSSANRAFFRAS